MHKPEPIFIRSFSRGTSDSCVNMVDYKSWWHIDSIMCLFLEHRRVNRSLTENITHTSANKQAGWTKIVAMIHPLIHHPSVLTSITAFPARCMEKKHFSNFHFQYKNCKCKYLTLKGTSGGATGKRVYGMWVTCRIEKNSDE